MTERIIDFTDPTIYVDRVEEFTSALYDPSIRYIFLKWWSWAGKSYLVAQVLLQNMMDGKRVWVFRKVSSTIRASCLQLFKDVKRSWEIPTELVDIKESKEIRTCNDGLCMMFWLDDEEKIKSLANFDWLRMEETTEFTFDDFQQLDLRLRGWTNHKIICSFNPVTAKSRLKREVEDHPENWENSVWISKTARDNTFVDENYLKALNNLKNTNEAKYKIYALNMWGEGAKGQIFENYNIFEKSIDRPDVMWLDFWFNDPNVLVYTKVEDVWETKDMYVEEKIYNTWQTSQDLIAEMDRLWVPKDILIIADSARPEMIADIHKAGYTIQWVKKYKNSKQEQIDNVKTYNIHIKGPNIVREVAEYSWKIDNKSWEPLDIPEDGDDHCMDAMSYAWTHYKKNEILALFI
jgi:phage terminase large subunit